MREVAGLIHGVVADKGVVGHTDDEAGTAARAGETRVRSLRVNIGWTLAGNIIYMGCQWAMSMAIAKLGSAVALGQFSLGMSIAAPLFMALGLQLRGVQATDARDEFRFGDYLLVRVVMSSVALVIIAMVAAGGYGLGVLTSETALVIGLVGIAKGAESLSDILYGLQQRYEEMRVIATSSIVKGVLSLLLLSGAMVAAGSVIGATAALAVSWTAVLWWRDLPCGVAVHRREGLGAMAISREWRAGWRLVKTVLPLGLMLFLISMTPVIPRLFIASKVSLRDLGIYAAITYVMMVGQTVVAAVGQSASPRLARLSAGGDRRGYLRLLSKLCLFGGVVGIGGVVGAVGAGELVLRFLYTAEYGDYGGALTIVMFAAALQYLATFIEYGITAAREFRAQVIPAGASLGVTVMASWLLIPTGGIIGACWTLVVGQFVALVGRGMVLGMVVRGMGDVAPR
jgi:O-antigen/teichoic acid export membrane protein